jgi:hypothetical protein
MDGPQSKRGFRVLCMMASSAVAFALALADGEAGVLTSLGLKPARASKSRPRETDGTGGCRQDGGACG